MPYYFAYGSNMNLDQMKQRCPESKLVGKAYLPDYKLGFTRQSKNWNSPVADALVSPGDEIWGVVYELTKNDIELLDIKEGHPEIYKRIKETAFLATDNFQNTTNDDIEYSTNPEDSINVFKRIEVELYEVVEKTLGLMPSLNYLTNLLDAAFDFQFPKKYQLELHSFGGQAYNEKLQLAIDELLDIQRLIKTTDISMLIKNQEEWGGANLVITGSASRMEQLNNQYPQDLVVLTDYWKELSWIVQTIYNNSKITWQVDYSNKHYLLNEIGKAALEYQSKKYDDFNHIGICNAVIVKAYKVITVDFHKKY